MSASIEDLVYRAKDARQLAIKHKRERDNAEQRRKERERHWYSAMLELGRELGKDPANGVLTDEQFAKAFKASDVVERERYACWAHENGLQHKPSGARVAYRKNGLTATHGKMLASGRTTPRIIAAFVKAYAPQRELLEFALAVKASGTDFLR